MSLDSLFRRIRGQHDDDRGSSIVIVIAYMAMGFIVAAVIASACIFVLRQNRDSEASVQSFTAAEAGRDAVVSALEIAPESCPATARYTDDPVDTTDPQFSVTLHPSNADAPPADSAGLIQKCPANTDKWVVLRSTGTAPDGSTSVVDAVYPWERFRTEVAGGALGYMDTSYSASFSSISGDTVIKHGNFTCNWGTVFKGNVFVLSGNVSVGVDLGRLTGEPSCEIQGDLFVQGNIVMDDPTWFLVWFYSRLKVGGQVKVVGNIDASGRLEAGTDASRTYKDIAVNGAILSDGSQGRVTTFNGGSIKATGEIKAQSGGTITSGGNLATNGNLVANAAISAASGIIVDQSISGSNTVSTSAGSIMAGGTISGTGNRTANGGSLTAVGDIDGTGTRSATISVLTRGSILGSGAVTATSGNIEAGASIAGGTRSAGGSVLAGVDISASTVSATAGDIHAGGILSGTGARTAGRSVFANGDISGGAVSANGGDIRTNGSIVGNANRTASGAISARGSISGNNPIQAKAGGISANVDITGTGARTAGNLPSTPTGTIQARGRIEISGGAMATNLLAVGNIKVDGTCTISGNVHASGTLTFDDVVGSQRAGWNAPTCAIGGNFWSSSATRSTLGTYTAATGGRANGTFPNTRIPTVASIRVPAGWTPTGSDKFMLATGVPGTAPTGTNPGAPTVADAPTVPAPTLAAVTDPTPFTIVLNEEGLDGTWETFDDLQLRTTWVDLGKYTTWTGYTVIPPITGTACTGNWLNPGGNVSSILSAPGNWPTTGTPLVRAGEPVVIDATACGNVNIAWSSFNLARDAVLLVDRATFNLAPFRATNLAAGETRQLYVVQVDPNNEPGIPAWGGTETEPIPHCGGTPTRPRINMTGTGWGSLLWDERVSVLLYSPCGVDGSIGKSWRGHIYVHNDKVTQDVLSNMVCAPMRIPGVVDLPCDINEVSSLGSMNVNAWRLGERVSQTEH